MSQESQSTQKVADRFYELAKQGQFDEIQDELYAQNVRSIEPEHSEFLQSVEGLDAVRQKAQQFNEMVEEMHDGYCSEPMVAGNHFTCTMGMDVTFKGQDRTKMDEVAVFKVENDKITEERFFF